MSEMTRKTLIRNGGLAASAHTLLAGPETDAAVAQSQAGLVFQILAFQWKPETSDAHKEQAAREIAALQGQIPGLLQTMWTRAFRREVRALHSLVSWSLKLRHPSKRILNIRRIKRFSHGW